MSDAAIAAASIPPLPGRGFGRLRLPNRADLWLAYLYGTFTWRARSLRSLGVAATRVERAWAEVAALGDDELRLAIDSTAAQMRRRPGEAHQTERALALLCEVVSRRIGLRPYREQMMGALALLRGELVEMATGEGKTLTAGLAAACAALRGQPVHVVTVNDYLAQRDAQWLRPVFEYCGLTVGTVVSTLDPAQRAAAYRCAVTYCTNKDVVFDYLRTQLAIGMQVSPRRAWLRSALRGEPQDGALVARLGFAIVDEADSVLIDEARTPLIIARDRDTGLGDLYGSALALAGALSEGEHFEIDRQQRLLELTESGRERLRGLAAGMHGIWRVERSREHLCLQALTALHLFDRDREYIVREGRVQIVDEFTGRVLQDRSWERGLHQMIELKEGCALTPQRETVARMTYQRFFTRYETLAGMTGTGREVAGELWAIYGLRVVPVPTHRPVLRRDHGVQMFGRNEDRWQAIAQRCRQMVDDGRAVLIGTRSVRQSEALSSFLQRAGVEHRVLNAKQDADEARIVAEAGEPGRVTVATNMAGRGTDIRLHPQVARRGGLHVILTEFHESARIDRQLFGRGARQGDPGSCEALVCVDDEVFRRFAPSWQAAVRRLRRGENFPSAAAAVLRRMAQRRAESLHARARLATLRQEARIEKMLAFAGRSR